MCYAKRAIWHTGELCLRNHFRLENMYKLHNMSWKWYHCIAMVIGVTLAILVVTIAVPIFFVVVMVIATLIKIWSIIPSYSFKKTTGGMFDKFNDAIEEMGTVINFCIESALGIVTDVAGKIDCLVGGRLRRAADWLVE